VITHKVELVVSGPKFSPSQKIQQNALNNFTSNPANRQTDKPKQVHDLFGGDKNVNEMVEKQNISH